MLIRTLRGIPEPDDCGIEHLFALSTEHDVLQRVVRPMKMTHEPFANRRHSCGVPIFANVVTTKCKQCETKLILRINPRLVCPFSTPNGIVNVLALLIGSYLGWTASGRKRCHRQWQSHMV